MKISERSKKIQNIALIGMLSACAVVLSAVESAVPTAGLLPPGVRLGLSNVVTMFTAFFFGFGGAAVIVAVKAGLAFFSRGAIAGLLSLCGGIFSAAAVCIVLKITKKHKAVSFYGVSIIGAVTHNLAQIAAVCVITQSPAYYYIPLLLVSGVAAGWVNALLIKLLYPYVSKNVFGRLNSGNDR